MARRPRMGAGVNLRYALRQNRKKKLVWLNGVNHDDHSNALPGNGFNITLVSSNSADIDIRQYTVKRIVGQIHTGPHVRPSTVVDTMTQFKTGLLIYVRPQDPSGTERVSLDAFDQNDTEAREIMWTRYDMHMWMGDGAGNPPYLMSYQVNSPVVDIKVQRTLYTATNDLMLTFDNSSESDGAAWYTANLRVLIALP